MTKTSPKKVEPPDEVPPTSPYGNARSGPLGPRRSPVDLYAEVLEVIHTSSMPCRVTRISYAVGMPVDRTRRILSLLVKLGLATQEGNEVPVWKLSRKGYDFLQSYWRMRSYLDPVQGFVY
jgi:predicted transcriptional regulator